MWNASRRYPASPPVQQWIPTFCPAKKGRRARRACVLAAAAVATDVHLLERYDVGVAAPQLRDHRRQLVPALDVPLQGSQTESVQPVTCVSI
jgi:hypothetical protein